MERPTNIITNISPIPVTPIVNKYSSDLNDNYNYNNNYNNSNNNGTYKQKNANGLSIEELRQEFENERKEYLKVSSTYLHN